MKMGLEQGRKPNLIMEKSLEFGTKMMELYKFLSKNNEFVISKQLLRSWTSIGANIMESKFWASKKDFLHKMRISLKEANESFYWLTLLQRSEMLGKDYKEYLKEINEIISILVKIVNTTRKNILQKDSEILNS